MIKRNLQGYSYLNTKFCLVLYFVYSNAKKFQLVKPIHKLDLPNKIEAAQLKFCLDNKY